MSTSKYDTDVDRSSDTSHARMLRLVGSNKRVLDVGCSTGYLAKALVAQGCTVSGVEYDEEAAEQARPHLERIVVGDLERLDLAEAFAGEAFDAIVFGDVLEHLRDPLPVLRSVRDLLAPGGSVVISVPNIAHADIRLSLLQGRFNYRDLGLLDVTHVRFFTRDNLRALLSDAGFVAVEVQTTTADVFGTELAEDARGVPPEVLLLLEDDIDATTYQFVVRAARDDAVQTAADTAWRAAELEKQLTASRNDLAAARVEMTRLSQELDAAATERAALIHRLGVAEAAAAAAERELQALHHTKLFRGARLPRAIWGRLRNPQA
jgi:2-polyprenyl-3-methyl-5-hydroxy-6-metoxy-1,4-benzoquinol methylase